MRMTTEHLDVLRIVHQLETLENAPGTKRVGERLLDVWKERGEPYSWHASAPWHGTNPFAEELHKKGLLDVDAGMADFWAPDQPASRADEHWLWITDAGRNLLTDAGPVGS